MNSKLAGIILLLSLPVSADSGSNWAAGSGYPFGGLLGVQYQFTSQQQQWSLAAGLVGVAASWQLTLGSEHRHAVGLTLGQENLTANQGFLTIDYLYYPDGLQNTGWFYGASAGVGQRRKGDLPIAAVHQRRCKPADRYQLLCKEPTTQQAIALLTVGYRF